MSGPAGRARVEPAAARCAPPAAAPASGPRPSSSGCPGRRSSCSSRVVSLVWLPYRTRATPRAAGWRARALTHWLGTDRLGRDLFTQLMVGARIALVVGLGAVAIGAAHRRAARPAAAFAGGWLDDTLSAALDILIAFPTAAARDAVRGRAGASLGHGDRRDRACRCRRSSRGSPGSLVKRVLAQQYITAARTSGTGWPGIVGQHVLPNIWPTLSVNLALQFGVAVLAEASLSYLGLGAPPPERVLGTAAPGGAGHGRHRTPRGDRPGHRARGPRHRGEPPRRRAAGRRRPDARTRDRDEPARRCASLERHRRRTASPGCATSRSPSRPANASG